MEGDQIQELRGDPWTGYEPTGSTQAVSSIKILAPCEPSKVIAIGLNYKDHAAEAKLELPQEPLVFLKAPSSIIAEGETIVIPKESIRTDYESELVVIMKDRCRNVPPSEALSHVLGYTCGNDVSERYYQKKDGQWARAKSFDTFGPMGPFIVTDVDPSDLRIEHRLNGVTRQNSRTSQLIFDVPAIISFCSRIMTLLPGDVIWTGTPAGVGGFAQPPLFLKDGDLCEVVVEGVGTLTNPVRQEQ